MGFTSKTIQPTGKWKSFQKPYHIIKYNGKEVGEIENDHFKIGLMVKKKDLNEDKNPNCEWKWIRFRGKFNSVKDAILFLNDNDWLVFEKYTLHEFEY